MSSLSTGTRWSCVSATRLHWRAWDDQYVIYNELSGNTHVLDPIAAFLLQEVSERPRSGNELLQETASSLDLGQDKDLYERIQQTLEKLDDLGLVESASS